MYYHSDFCGRPRSPSSEVWVTGRKVNFSQLLPASVRPWRPLRWLGGRAGSLAAGRRQGPRPARWCWRTRPWRRPRVPATGEGPTGAPTGRGDHRCRISQVTRRTWPVPSRSPAHSFSPASSWPSTAASTGVERAASGRCSCSAGCSGCSSPGCSSRGRSSPRRSPSTRGRRPSTGATNGSPFPGVRGGGPGGPGALSAERERRRRRVPNGATKQGSVALGGRVVRSRARLREIGVRPTWAPCAVRSTAGCVPLAHPGSTASGPVAVGGRPAVAPPAHDGRERADAARDQACEHGSDDRRGRADPSSGRCGGRKQDVRPRLEQCGYRVRHGRDGWHGNDDVQQRSAVGSVGAHPSSSPSHCSKGTSTPTCESARAAVRETSSSMESGRW